MSVILYVIKKILNLYINGKDKDNITIKIRTLSLTFCPNAIKTYHLAHVIATPYAQTN